MSIVDTQHNSAIIEHDRTPHASLGNDEADQAGSCSFLPLKPALSLDQQINHLVEKGLPDDSISIADISVLLRKYGYYRLKGYYLTLEKNGRFLDGTRPAHIEDIADFDQAVRLLVFDCLSTIEIKLRLLLANELALTYGPRALHEPTAFKNGTHFDALQLIIKRETRQALDNKKPLVIHNLKTYGELPIWAELENTSFGAISKIFNNLSDLQIARKIASEFGLSRIFLSNWLRYLCQIRNICAHHDRLYNKLFCVRPRLFREHRNLDTARLFPVFIVLFKLLESFDDASALRARKELAQTIERFPTVDLEPVGFPANWKEILGIPSEAKQKQSRQRGKSGGRRPKDPAAIEDALFLYDLKEDSISQICRKTGVSSTTLYKYIKLRDA